MTTTRNDDTQEVSVNEIFNENNTVTRARQERLQEKDWKNLWLIHEMIGEMLKKDKDFYQPGEKGERSVLDFVKSRMKKYSNIEESLINLDDSARERLYKVSFDSPFSKRREYFLVAFDKQNEFPPDVIPPGVLLREEIR